MPLFFNNNPKVKELQKKVLNLQNSGYYVQSLELKKKISHARQIAINELIAERKEKVERIQIFDAGLSKEEQTQIATLGVCLGIVCDCLETYSMEINDILKRHDQSLSYEEFYNTINLVKESRKHLDWIAKNSNLRNLEEWGDKCDDLIDYIKERARELIQL